LSQQQPTITVNTKDGTVHVNGHLFRPPRTKAARRRWVRSVLETFSTTVRLATLEQIVREFERHLGPDSDREFGEAFALAKVGERFSNGPAKRKERDLALARQILQKWSEDHRVFCKKGELVQALLRELAKELKKQGRKKGLSASTLNRWQTKRLLSFPASLIE
jgi:hypothetical protein